VVRLGRLLGDRHGRRVREAVRGPDDEGLERVLRVEARVLRRRGGGTARPPASGQRAGTHTGASARTGPGVLRGRGAGRVHAARLGQDRSVVVPVGALSPVVPSVGGLVAPVGGGRLVTLAGGRRGVGVLGTATRRLVLPLSPQRRHTAYGTRGAECAVV